MDTLEKRYFYWLVDQIASDGKHGKRQYLDLLWQLQNTIFVAIVPHDENRIADAEELRHEFLSDNELERGGRDWMRSPCSMLELLIILATQLDFEVDGGIEKWFWRLIQNVNLHLYHDERYNEEIEERVSNILDQIVWRQYRPDGLGGLFPLMDARHDQRDIELWYQLNAYLIEHY